MRAIAAAEILKQLHPDATAVSLRQMNGEACREISVADLKRLVAAGMVACAIIRGHRQFRLTVPTDQAFRALGESSAKVKDLFHSDASVTVMRSAAGIPRIYKQHHPARCSAWPHLAKQEHEGAV